MTCEPDEAERGTRQAARGYEIREREMRTMRGMLVRHEIAWRQREGGVRTDVACTASDKNTLGDDERLVGTRDAACGNTL